MTFLFLACLMYFLPAIVGRNKRDAGLIFLVNLFFGWTVVGWIVALIWACTTDARVVPVYATGPACYCSRCGMPQMYGARFCGGCGRPL
ncbi:MAG: superinfection immunity protein [Candidatus Acidiferrales bacterium]